MPDQVYLMCTEVLKGPLLVATFSYLNKWVFSAYYSAIFLADARAMVFPILFLIEEVFSHDA